MSGTHFDKLMKILDRQVETKMTPKTLMAYLGMMNLMSIMSLVHADEGSGELSLTDTSGLDLQNIDGEKNLKETISSLLPKATQKSGGLDLSSLMSMVGGDKKMNPQMMLTLMNLLNSMNTKSGSDKKDVKAEVKEKNDSKEKTRVSETKSEKKSKLI